MGRKKIIAGDPDEVVITKAQKSHGRFWQLGLVVVAVFFILSCLILLKRCQNIQSENDSYKKAANDASLQATENEKILKEVGAKALLPAGKPLMIFLASAEQIALWPSLANTKIGDWLLFYPDRLIIWRPETKQIVLSDTANSLFASSAKQAGISVGIRNGSEAKGVASDLADNLTADSRFKVVEISNAATSSYVGNLIVNLSAGEIPAELLAKFSGNTTNTLPINEASTTAEFLLIIGK